MKTRISIFWILILIFLVGLLSCQKEINYYGLNYEELEELANKDDAMAQYHLGVGYYSGGYGGVIDYEKAVAMFLKAADQGLAVTLSHFLHHL